MKILQLNLTNFRGIKEHTVKFDGLNTDIYAANGYGKTTIANAICWLLVDRPATDEKDFTPQTVGMHEVEHSAEMLIAADSGEHITLKKVFYENWKKKKGSATKEFSGTVTDCYIDGVKAKTKDYVATVERICGVGLERIRLLMVLGYFADTMKNEEKRKILFELCGEFSDADVIAANAAVLADLPTFLAMPGDSNKQYTIEQFKNIAVGQRKDLNKALEMLPVRIDELTKGLPKTKADIAELKNELAKLESELASLEDEARQAKKTDTQKEALRSAVAKLKTEIETKRGAYIRQGADMNRDINAAIDNLAKEQRETNDKIFTLTHQKQARVMQHDRLTEKRQELVSEYAAVNQEKWDAGAEICPTCGQKLPADKVKKLREEFNVKKSEKLAAINRRGQECSQKVLQRLNEEIADTDKQLTELDARYKDGQRRLANLQETLTPQIPFEETEEYNVLQGQIDELHDKMNTEADASDETAKIYADKIAEVKAKITVINGQIAEEQVAENTKARIAELEQKTKNTAKELERVEYGIHLCEEFTRTKARLITESINKHFRLVNFKLFRDQINGGLKEICEPMVKNQAGEWVEYKSVNFAGQINAQLDICETLNKHYGVNLPVIIDQAESVVEPLAVTEQRIRLIVSADDKGLRVEQREAEKSIINQTQATAKTA